VGWARQPYKAHAAGINGKGIKPKKREGELNKEGVLVGLGRSGGVHLLLPGSAAPRVETLVRQPPPPPSYIY